MREVRPFVVIIFERGYRKGSLADDTIQREYCKVDHLSP
jgi:hypothetical protein